jgi:hypothetical protein
LLATGGVLLAFLVLDSASEVLAQREGGAFWAHSHMAAHMVPTILKAQVRKAASKHALQLQQSD